MQDVAK